MDGGIGEDCRLGTRDRKWGEGRGRMGKLRLTRLGRGHPELLVEMNSMIGGRRELSSIYHDLWEKDPNVHQRRIRCVLFLSLKVKELIHSLSVMDSCSLFFVVHI